MLVQSSLPPIPTSMTATSTCISLKYLKAKAVVSSKKDGLRLLNKSMSRDMKSAT